MKFGTSSTGEHLLDTSGKNPDCVEQLERLLQKARDGEVVGIAGAVQFKDGSTSTHRSGFIYNQRIIGALFQMATNISQG